MQLKIVYRACDKVFCDHEVGRPFASDKKTIIKVCFNSLIESLQEFDYHIDVVGDALSDEIQAFFRSYDNVTVHNHEFKHTSESIIAALDQALTYDDEAWVYTCEDDYLHVEHFAKYFQDFVDNKEEYLAIEFSSRNKTQLLTGDLSHAPLFIYPADYPERYHFKKRQFALLFISKYCHWRQINNTTHTFAAQRKTIKQFEKVIRKSGEVYDDGYMSKHTYGKYWLRNKALCVSPIPGLATHLTENVMTPFVNWQTIFEKNLQQINAR